MAYNLEFSLIPLSKREFLSRSYHFTFEKQDHGTGMGFVVVHGLVMKQEGAIIVENRLGREQPPVLNCRW